MKLELNQVELEFLRMALNEAMDATDNEIRYNVYKVLLDEKLS